MTSFHKPLVVGMALAEALLVAAPAVAEPAREHVDEVLTFTETGIDNPCTPEFDDLTLEITDRVQGSTWTGDGTVFIDLHITGHGRGIAADGTRYEAKLNLRETSELDDGERHEFQAMVRFVSHGRTPNFIVQEWGTFTTPPPDVTFDRRREICVG